MEVSVGSEPILFLLCLSEVRERQSLFFFSRIFRSNQQVDTPKALNPERIVLRFSCNVPTVAVLISDRRKGLMVNSRRAVRSGMVGMSSSAQVKSDIEPTSNQ